MQEMIIGTLIIYLLIFIIWCVYEIGKIKGLDEAKKIIDKWRE